MGDIKTNYYIVAVDDNGDVLAVPAMLKHRKGIDITVESIGPDYDVHFDNQGDTWQDKWESASTCLAAVMPDDDEDDPEILDALNNHGQDG